MESTTIQFQATPEQSKDDVYLRNRISKELSLDLNEFEFSWRRRSIDARKRDVKVNCTFDVFEAGNEPVIEKSFTPKNVEGKQKIAIIGSGPAGLFAALQALELGLKTVIF